MSQDEEKLCEQHQQMVSWGAEDQHARAGELSKLCLPVFAVASPQTWLATV